MVSSSLYRPYGAFELKATYQRNFMIGNLVTVSLILVLMTAFWLPGLLSDDKTDVLAIREIISISVDPQPPLTIIRENSEWKSKIKPAVIPDGAIPKPLPDDQISDEDDIIIPSREELIEIIDGKYGGFEDGSGVGYELGTGGDVDYIPRHDEFIMIEKLPQIIKQAKPEYPRLTRLAGIEGDVSIKVLIGKDGKVLDAVIAVSSGTQALDKATIKAAFKSVYSPGIQSGRPVNVWVSYKVEFRLN